MADAAAAVTSARVLAACTSGGVQLDTGPDGDHDLDVALELGFGAARAHDDPPAVEVPREHVAGWEPAPGVAVAEVDDVEDRPTGQVVGRVAAQARHRRAEPVHAVGTGDASRPLAGGVDAVATVEVVEDVVERAPGVGLQGRRLGEDERGGDAVLVAHEVTDAEAERLLVGEEPVLLGPAARESHLNPVSVSTWATPASAAMERSSVDDTIVVATTAPSRRDAGVWRRR